MFRRNMLYCMSVLCFLSVVFSGCQCRYVANRVYDFCDIFQVGVGVTSENPESGILPPSLGLHLQCTEYINLGAVYFDGYSMEWDGRGFFAGPEKRMRMGLGPSQCVQIDQDYDEGYENYFKKANAPWTKRMNSTLMRWSNKPAKELEYEYWADTRHLGCPVMHRGWQYWENAGIELGICEPFCTHLGLNLRLGFDHSEVSDLILGIFTIDFKHDDLTRAEFGQTAVRDFKPASD